MLETEEEYWQTLRRIEEIWGAPPDSAEGLELDKLIYLLTQYEDAHFPIEPPTPSEARKFRQDQERKGSC